MTSMTYFANCSSKLRGFFLEYVLSLVVWRDYFGICSTERNLYVLIGGGFQEELPSSLPLVVVGFFRHVIELWKNGTLREDEGYVSAVRLSLVLNEMLLLFFPVLLLLPPLIKADRTKLAWNPVFFRLPSSFSIIIELFS
ncbi:hypothetical protein EV360DRAFT_75890 [Lentinula raphanica]|nr:hypothetical protein EV360DRAFT_75890 [Lentinula raphanica]